MLYKTYCLVLSLLCLVLILPIIGIISKIEFNILDVSEFFQNKYNIKIVTTTIIQAFLSALLSCIIAIPLALSLYRHKNLKIIKFIVSLCGFLFVMPSILIVYSVIGIYGSSGTLNNATNFYNFFQIKTLFGLKAIILAHILLNAPFATRLFFQNLNTIPKSYLETGSSLNLNFFANIYKIEWPILKQNLLSVFSIIFVLCFLSFAIVMALGGGPSNSTLEVSIYQSVIFELNFNKAIILSIIQILICLSLLIFGFYKLKGTNFFDIQKNYFIHPFKDIFLVKFFDYLIITICSLILFSPIFYILFNFIEILFTESIFHKFYFLNALKNSFILSFVTGILVTIIGFIVSLVLVSSVNYIFLQQILFLLSTFILIISPIIVSLGYFIILGDLRYINWISFIVIIIINCLFLLPFAILILFNNLKNIYLNYRDIKITFRINEMNFIKIIYPLIKNNLFYIFAFSTAISLGDFTVISFFKNSSLQTLPTLLYKLIISYRFNEASFVAGFMLIFTLVIYLIFDNNFYKDKPDKIK